MNVWQKIYEDRLSQAERKLEILAQEYNRIGKSDELRLIRKSKVQEIKLQCKIVRHIRDEYARKIKEIEKCFTKKNT